MRVLALALALALPGAAQAHDPTLNVNFDPSYAWAQAPGNRIGADGLIRLVPQANHGLAALGVDTYYAYQQAYRRHLARLSMRMPISQAEAHARHAAWHEVIAPANAIRARELDLEPLRAGALPLGLLR